MTKNIIVSLLFLYTIDTLADVKNREKAQFELISSIEILVNIDECRKGIHADDGDSSLPRACNSLARLSKYFFDKVKDRAAIDEYLNNEEARTTRDALTVVDTFKFKKLGKMILSSKCVKNNEPVDLDIYLDRIKGIPAIDKDESSTATTDLEHQFKNKKTTQNELIPMKPGIRNTEPRNPATDRFGIESDGF